MDQVIFAGLDLNDEVNGYVVEAGIEGLEAADISLTSYDRAGEDGIRVPNGYSRGRLITIPGLIRGDCVADHLTRRRALSSLIPPVRNANDVLSDKTLRIVDGDGGDYTFAVQVQQPFSMPRRNLMNSRYLLHLLASDPAIYGTAEHTLTLTPATGGSFTVPFIVPFTLSGGTSGEGTAANGGDLNTFPVITLSGPLTNPTIRNVTTGLSMQLQMTILTGATVVIDMQNKTIIQDGSINQLDKMTAGSDWWWLQPGNNTIRLTTSTSAQTGTAVLSWHDALAGL